MVGESRHLHLPKSSFVEFWSEAVVIIGAITDIELISELKFQPVQDKESLIKEVLKSRDECIEESHQMFVGGMFQLFLDQYGANYKNLPADTQKNIADARNRINA